VSAATNAKKTTVSIVRTGKSPEWSDIDAAVREAVGLAGGLGEIVKPGSRVMIKPNLVGMPDERYPGGLTNPLVCRAVADMVRELGGRPLIAESSQRGTDTDEVMRATGYAELRDQGYEVVDLKTTPLVELRPSDPLVMKKMDVFELATEVDAVISVPVLKTHDQLEITLGLKNMKGLISDRYKRLFHQEGVIEGVVDLCRLITPSFTVVDGILGQEGMGPLFGIPVEMDLIVAGRDPVAVDAVAGRIMGFEPAEVPITALAAEKGLGVMEAGKIEIAGEPVEKVRRRFVRAHEDERAQFEGFDLIYDEGTCTGCRNGVYSVLFDLKNQGMLEYLRGSTILVGASELPEGVSTDRLIAIGRCCKNPVRKVAVYVKGCPPNNSDIVEAIKKVGGTVGGTKSGNP